MGVVPSVSIVPSGCCARWVVQSVSVVPGGCCAKWVLCQDIRTYACTYVRIQVPFTSACAVFPNSCSVDLSKLNIEVTQEMVLNLDEGEGKIHMLLTISGHSERVWSEESIDSCEMMQRPSSVDWEEIKKKYVSLMVYGHCVFIECCVCV